MALDNLTVFGKTLGKSKKAVEAAFSVANEVQDRFYRTCLDEGSDFLASLKPGEKVMVLVGRPYNSMDPGASLNVHKKLSDLGVASIPIDMLPLDVVEEDELKDMYWGYGQKILGQPRSSGRTPTFTRYISPTSGADPTPSSPISSRRSWRASHSFNWKSTSYRWRRGHNHRWASRRSSTASRTRGSTSSRRSIPSLHSRGDGPPGR